MDVPAIPQFDLFREEHGGIVRWVGAVADVHAGQEKASELMKSEPGKYFVFDHTTGNKLYVEPAVKGPSHYIHYSLLQWPRLRCTVVHYLNRSDGGPTEKERSMLTFDILRLESSGVRWLESEVDLTDAKARVEELASTSGGEYLIFSHETQKKRIIQIGDEERQLKARAELFRRFGDEVISFSDCEAAKAILQSSIPVDLFIVGHSAPQKIRREMVQWLKKNYPNSKILALAPSLGRPILNADYNVVLSGKYGWLCLLTVVAVS